MVQNSVNFATHNYSKPQSAVRFTAVHSDFADFSQALAAGTAVIAPPAKAIPQPEPLPELISRSDAERDAHRQESRLRATRGMSESEWLAWNAQWREEARNTPEVRLSPEEIHALEDGTHHSVCIGAQRLPEFFEHLRKAAADGESLVSAITHWRLNNRIGYDNRDPDASGVTSAFLVCTFTGQVRHYFTSYLVDTTNHNPFAPPLPESVLIAESDRIENAVAAHKAAVPSMAREMQSFIQELFGVQGDSVFNDILLMGGLR